MELGPYLYAGPRARIYRSNTSGDGVQAGVAAASVEVCAEVCAAGWTSAQRVRAMSRRGSGGWARAGDPFFNGFSSEHRGGDGKFLIEENVVFDKESLVSALRYIGLPHTHTCQPAAGGVPSIPLPSSS